MAMPKDEANFYDMAEDGLIAAEKAKANKYDFILMEMLKPNIDGLKATRTIRSLPEYKSTPIVAMTANAFSEVRKACKDKGMNDFISKPVSPDMLYTVLLKWLK